MEFTSDNDLNITIDGQKSTLQSALKLLLSGKKCDIITQMTIGNPNISYMSYDKFENFVGKNCAMFESNDITDKEEELKSTIKKISEPIDIKSINFKGMCATYTFWITPTRTTYIVQQIDTRIGYNKSCQASVLWKLPTDEYVFMHYRQGMQQLITFYKLTKKELESIATERQLIFVEDE